MMYDISFYIIVLCIILYSLYKDFRSGGIESKHHSYTRV